MNQKRLCAWGRGAEQGLVYETADSVSLMLCEITARMTVDLRVWWETKRASSCWWIYKANGPVYLRTGTKGGACAK